MKSLWKLAAVMGAVALVSCGGGGGSDAPTTVAAANTNIAVNPTTGPTAVQAVSGQAVSFASGVPAFGTTTSTSLTITAGASPTFSVAENGKTASGDLAFGSCIFKVKTSTFTSGPLVAGGQVTVSPCTITVGTANVPANGSAVTVPVTVTLNTTASAAIQQVISVSPSGTLTINGNTITVTPVKSVTGS